MKLISLVALISGVIACVVALFVEPAEALALDRTFAGSLQVDYHFVPTAREANAQPLTFDGFTLEAAMKVSVDFNEHLSANVKVCYSCHGFETDMAYFDYRVADALTVRLGRFSPSFGAFNLRHDPANHRLSDKPLPYDMGRMLRMRAWNQGVLPSPFPDNGLEIAGAVAISEDLRIDYAAHAVSGFKAPEQPLDIDFTQSRSGSVYYVDNNGRPSVGGRLSLTWRLNDDTDATIGGSVMHGTYDPRNSLAYTIAGADLSLRVVRTNVRVEWLARRTDIDASDPSRLRYALIPGEDHFAKHGAYVEIEQPLVDAVDAIARVDGLYRMGNVPSSTSTLPDGPIVDESNVVRFTLGSAISLDRGLWSGSSLRLKTSAEYWRFSDDDSQGKSAAVSFHLGAVGSF